MGCGPFVRQRKPQRRTGPHKLVVRIRRSRDVPSGRFAAIRALPAHERARAARPNPTARRVPLDHPVFGVKGVARTLAVIVVDRLAGIAAPDVGHVMRAIVPAPQTVAGQSLKHHATTSQIRASRSLMERSDASPRRLRLAGLASRGFPPSAVATAVGTRAQIVLVRIRAGTRVLAAIVDVAARVAVRALHPLLAVVVVHAGRPSRMRAASFSAQGRQ